MGDDESYMNSSGMCTSVVWAPYEAWGMWQNLVDYDFENSKWVHTANWRPDARFGFASVIGPAVPREILEDASLGENREMRMQRYWMDNMGKSQTMDEELGEDAVLLQQARESTGAASLADGNSHRGRFSLNIEAQESHLVPAVVQHFLDKGYRVWLNDGMSTMFMPYSHFSRKEHEKLVLGQFNMEW